MVRVHADAEDQPELLAQVFRKAVLCQQDGQCLQRHDEGEIGAELRRDNVSLILFGAVLAVTWIPNFFIVARASPPLLESLFACSRLRRLEDLRDLLLHLILIRVLIDATHVILISDRRHLPQVQCIDLASAPSDAFLVLVVRLATTLVAQDTSRCERGRALDRLRVDRVVVAREVQVKHAIEKDLDLFD